MLVRASAIDGIEVFLVRRSARSAFAPDAFVFPGGTVDPVDYDPGEAERLADDVFAQFRTNVPSELPCDQAPIGKADGLAIARAALRELHEEAGVRLSHVRDLYLFSHWVTPPSEPRRYNTYFFLACAPDGQTARADARETHDGLWISPDNALERARRGALHVVYPTLKHLERLLPFDRIDALLAFAQQKPILTIMPSDSPANGFAMPPSLEDVW